MAGNRQRSPSELWAVTSYFNPLRYRRRRENYITFRRKLSVPLVAVELAFDGPFELTQEDADHLIRIRGGDLMFQKERLLNIALQALPPECSAVAWIDCDVIFNRADWPERALQGLKTNRLLHLYEAKYDLSAESDPGEPSSWLRQRARRSAVSRLARGEITIRAIREGTSSPGTTWGCAWAAHRDLLDGRGFYDACIIGGGDAAMLFAAVGDPECVRKVCCMSVRHYDHYVEWAGPFHEVVQSQVGWLEGSILHLWHGERDNRRYRERHERMLPFDFDPRADIRINEQGVWQWSSDKAAFHAYVAEYFRSRLEDG